MEKTNNLNLRTGDKIKINILLCQDEDVLNWYMDREDELVTVRHIEEEVNGVWVEDCDYRIDLDEIILVYGNGYYVCIRDDENFYPTDFAKEEYFFKKGKIYKGEVHSDGVFFYGEDNDEHEFKYYEIDKYFLKLDLTSSNYTIKEIK